MKKTLCVLALLAVAAPARAGNNPLDDRRTLFVPAGQRMLALEAPVGMCFLDPSYRQERAVSEDMQDILEETGGGQLLGIFAPCLSVAGLDAGANGGVMNVSGVVTWLNPAVGETTDLSERAYLAMQDSKFRTWLDRNLGDGDDDTDAAAPAPASLTPAYAALLLPWPGDYEFDEKAKRTDSSVTVGYTATLDRDDLKSAAFGVAATAVVKHTPIALYLNDTRKNPYDARAMRDLADKFMAQQIALNK